MFCLRCSSIDIFESTCIYNGIQGFNPFTGTLNQELLPYIIYKPTFGLYGYQDIENDPNSSLQIDIDGKLLNLPPGPKLRLSDNPFSVCPDEMEEIVFKVKKTNSYMGSGEIDKIDTEDYMWNFRRNT